MSGGAFDYKEHFISYIRTDIEDVILKNRKEKDKKHLERWDYDENGNIRPECKYYYDYSDETIERFKEAVEILKKAEIYAHRIDYLLSDDDGEKSFHERLNEELKELEIKKAIKL